jgi:SagB-type dehydrogenase family enzyme
MGRVLHGLGALVSAVVLVACDGGPSSTPGGGTVAPAGAEEMTIVQLPAPRTDGDVSLEEALLRRRSVRAFTDEVLDLPEISQLLWAAQGVTAEWGGRTAPSAGALYPLRVFVATPDALYRYLPSGHRAEILSGTDLRGALARAALDQEAVRDAPAVFVIAADDDRTAAKYGGRGERYVHLEAGHATQNLLLQAVAMGLGGVPVGAFSDEDVARVLDLPADLVPLYLVPIGHPAA